MFWGFQNNYSLIFDGVNEYVSGSDSAALDFERTNAFSISFWIKRNAINNVGHEMIVGKYDSSTVKGYLMWFQAIGAGYDNQIIFDLLASATDRLRVKANTTISDTNWHHIVATYNGNSIPSGVNIYIDGTASAMTTILSALSNTILNNVGWSVASRLGTPGLYANAKIDEVSIWNIALTVAQVSEIYSNGRPANLSGHSGKSGLIGWWRMGDQATWDGTNFTIPDESINNNAGTSVNMEAVDKSTDVPVISFSNTKSLNFDGVNEKVNFGDAAPFQFERTNPFSLSIWAKTTEAVSSKVILAKQDSGSTPGYRIYKKTSGRIEVLLVNSSSNRIDIETSTVAINDGVWHHVVMTYSGSSTAAGVKIYVDGVSAAITVNTNSLTLSILNAIAFQMAAAWNVSLPFIGNLDEPSVWNKELSAAEVTEIYNSGKPKNLLTHSASVNLVGWWRNGDGDTFPTLIDNSVNANDGTMTNMEAGDIQTDVP